VSSGSRLAGVGTLLDLTFTSSDGLPDHNVHPYVEYVITGDR
jgi:hypothetical protein